VSFADRNLGILMLLSELRW